MKLNAKALARALARLASFHHYLQLLTTLCVARAVTITDLLDA